MPVVGWCWIFTESIFLRRIWESDRETLVKDLGKVLNEYPDNYYFNVSLALFSPLLDDEFDSRLVSALLRRHAIH